MLLNLLKVTGKTIKQTAMASISTLTVQSTKEIGRMTSSMVRVMRPGLMAASSMATMLIQRSKAKESTPGLMETNTWVIGRTMQYPVMESISGATEEFMQVNGKTT